ncbi:N-acetylglucosamine-6-phosphate deacetylase [Oceaniglobus indicus]|uniref:N-acetylglucosamine-6-phosphate deacetylase n=1 Tax=Oceaniglobus indicus TaxID=2047749 RepID=UPI000C179812|nr:N-acetylglucosamine-6-phosphate deacetylase [Oceaniglobus indicus]
MTHFALMGADIFDGHRLHSGAALLLKDGAFAGLASAPDVPQGFAVRQLDGGTLCPGFVDLQVNGGGGVMFNDITTADGLAAIAAAHATTGTRWLLPTLITDTPEKTRAAIDAVELALARGVPGLAGLHLEGPHLARARKGAHDPALIRPMEDADEALLIDAAARLPNLMVTLAPETVPIARIARLAQAGIIVSLGHSDCSFEAASAAIAAGARCITHLFNAMSQMTSRAPGLVGAALHHGAVSAGLIADIIHVHAATMRIALAAKTGPGRVFLVSDAMSTVGADITSFTLNGRKVLRREGRLTLEDGTLAGADLDFPTAIGVLRDHVGVSLADALAMVTTGPASLLRQENGAGSFQIGRPWEGVYLDRAGKIAPLPV